MSMQPKLLRNHRILDATDDLVLNINPSDVARASAKDPLNCAAARALRRQHGVVEVCVMRARTYVNYGTKRTPEWVRYLTPEPLAREIVAIDRGGYFHPDTYYIKAPSKSQRLGQRRRGTRGAGKRRKARDEPLHRHVTAEVREVKSV